MKTLFTFALLFVGMAAFANNDNNTNPAETEKNAHNAKSSVAVTSRKEAAAPRYKEPKQQARMAEQKPPCTTAVDTRFGISDAFVEFVNKSNLKLVKYLLAD